MPSGSPTEEDNKVPIFHRDSWHFQQPLCFLEQKTPKADKESNDGEEKTGKDACPFAEFGCMHRGEKKTVQVRGFVDRF